MTFFPIFVETPKIKYYPTLEVMEKEGWKFSWNIGEKFLPKIIKTSSVGSDPTRRWRKFCKDVPYTSYCGFNEYGDGTISFTFPKSGTAELKYGQSYNKGSVHVRKNKVEISARSTPGTSNSTFEVSAGDVLDIEEKMQNKELYFYAIIFYSLK